MTSHNARRVNYATSIHSFRQTEDHARDGAEPALALMLVEEPPRALVGNIAGGKTGDRHGLSD